MSVFEKRISLKPLEFPELYDFVDAMNHSYWVVTEFNFDSDIQDFHVNISSAEKTSITRAMLAISQIEISVKRFWANLYNQFPKPEFDALGVTFGECHGEGTEVLTSNGWVSLEDIQIGDEVLQYHIENNSFSSTIVKEKIKKYFKGNLINFNKRKLKTFITPKHEIVFRDKKGRLHKKTADNLNIHSDLRLPESGSLRGGEVNKLSNEDKLRIAIQADGHKRFYRKRNGEKSDRGLAGGSQTYSISIKKERKKNRLIDILNNLNIGFRKWDLKREGYTSFEIDIDRDFDYKTFDWVNLTNKTSNWCKEFVEELAEWDGTKIKGHSKDCKIKYSSTDKKCVDKVQLVGIGAGYKCNISIRKDNRKETYKDIYIVSFISNRTMVRSNLKKELIPYNGNVYCISVDSGIIMTRYENTTFISSNCETRHQRAYSHLLELLGLNDEFDKLVENPVIQGRIEYLTKYLKNAGNNNKEYYTLSLALFSLFIENCSLFSQFLIIKSFNKHKNLFKGIDNVVQATSREEDLHAKAGIHIINLIKKECPDWFNEDFYSTLERACLKAYNAEEKIIDWIFEKGELSFLSKQTVLEFIKDRFNTSMEQIGAEKVFDTNKDVLKHTEWFNLELISDVHTDFFWKTSVNYSKKTQPITEKDLF